MAYGEQDVFSEPWYCQKKEERKGELKMNEWIYEWRFLYTEYV